MDGFDSEAENKATTRQGCGQDAGRNAEMAQKKLKKLKINNEVGLMTDFGLRKDFQIAKDRRHPIDDDGLLFPHFTAIYLFY